MSYLIRQGNNLVLRSDNVLKPLKIVKSCTGSLGVAGLQIGRQVGGNSLGNSHYGIMLLSEEIFAIFHNFTLDHKPDNHLEWPNNLPPSSDNATHGEQYNIDSLN